MWYKAGASTPIYSYIGVHVWNLVKAYLMLKVAISG